MAAVRNQKRLPVAVRLSLQQPEVPQQLQQPEVEQQLQQRAAARRHQRLVVEPASPRQEANPKLQDREVDSSTLNVKIESAAGSPVAFFCVVDQAQADFE